MQIEKSTIEFNTNKTLLNQENNLKIKNNWIKKDVYSRKNKILLLVLLF